MNKEYCLKLCLAVYKVTKSFPEKEPLKFNIRGRVNNILVKLISCNPSATLLDKKTFSKDVEILNAYFGIAQQQNWVNPDNFTILQKEFNKLKQEFEGNDKRDKGEQGNLGNKGEDRGDMGNVGEEELQGRQKKILEIIKQKQECKMFDIANSFQTISRRTLQRDLDFLYQRGLIKRQGEHRNLVYAT